MAIKAVIFDLDGTLVDSAADIAEAVNRLFDALQLPRVEPALVRSWIGDGVRALVATALAHHGSRQPLDQALALFMTGYHDCLLRSPQLYPGVRETLQALQQAAVPMAICTNKPVALVPPLLQHLGIEEFFPVIIGGGSLPLRKPDPAPLLASAAGLGVAVAQCLMVGDSGTDHAAAQAAAMPVALVRYGYPRTLDVDAVPALAVVDDLRQLLPLLLPATALG
ncbi:MAG: phosphoglycolate phosphatase [Stenotrophomonas sp.]